MARRSQSSTHDLSGGSCPLPTMRMAPQQRGLLRGRRSCCRAFTAWSRREAPLSPSPAVMGCCSRWDGDAPNWRWGARWGTHALISRGIYCIHSQPLCDLLGDILFWLKPLSSGPGRGDGRRNDLTWDDGPRHLTAPYTLAASLVSRTSPLCLIKCTLINARAIVTGFGSRFR